MQRFAARIAAVVVLAFGLGACQSGTDRPRPISAAEFNAPLEQGTTRVGFPNGVDVERWRIVKEADFTRYHCLALACSAPTQVVYGTAKSTTTKPNPDALLKYGQAHLSRSRESANGAGRYLFKSGKTTLGQFKGYPAVFIDEEGVFDGKPRYARKVVAICGGITVIINAFSNERAAARAAFDEFEGRLEVKYAPRS